MITDLLKSISSKIHIFYALFWLMSSIFLAISLSSYNYVDPSFNRFSYVEISNWAGLYGAYIADPILQLFGISASLFILVFLVWGILFFIDHRVKFFILRLIFLFISLISYASFLACFETSDRWIFTSYGGLLGEIVANILHKKIPIFFYSAMTVFLICLYLSLGISFSRWSTILSFVFSKFVYIYDILSYIIRITFRIFILIYRKFTGINSNDSIKISFKKDKPIVKLKAVPAKTLKKIGSYEFPTTALLQEVYQKDISISKNDIAENTKELKQVLDDFGVNGKIIDVHTGPVVTLYELEPAAGTKSSRVIGLSDDISRSMKALSARIAVVPGRNAIGIELPNKERQIVFLRELLESKEYINMEHELPIILGKDISGYPIVVDLAKMPHLLVAGTTGSGKSVGINTMILSLVYKLTPDQCRLILIDPKMLELSVYDNIPHLMTPVVTEPKKAVVALKWVVKEMENRYRLMSTLNVRNIKNFNQRILDSIKTGEILERIVQTGFNPDTGMPVNETIPIEKKTLPYIVVIVDEMADLMLVAGKDIEVSIQRLAQMARAAGIHIIMATQRPSVDVITGVIKANFPTRISFQVTSRIDSRTILGEQGAEQLLGKGDMLYMAGGSRLIRIHGPFVSDGEVEKVVNHLKNQAMPNYIDDVTTDSDDSDFISNGSDDTKDDLYQQALEIILQERKASTSFLQRCLKIGYNRAANIMEKMEKNGVVSAPNHVGKREILI